MMIGEIDFYQKPLDDYRKKFVPGQVFYAPIPFFYSKKIDVLRLDYLDKSKPENCNFTIDSYNPSQINNIKPIPEINIHQGEMIVCIKHKVRPVIGISKKVPHRYSENKDDGNCMLIAPLYTTVDKGGNYKYSELFLRKIQAYSYPNLFLIPEDNNHDAKESIVRFDRAVFIPTTYLNHCPIMLSVKALGYLIKWFHFLTLGKEDETISLYRELLLEQYPNIT